MHGEQRVNNRGPIFFDDAAYQGYLGELKEAAEHYFCTIQAYVLMIHPVPSLATPKDKKAISRMMQ